LTKEINNIGILGGGQLGRMLIQAAIDFNVEISVLDPDPNAPCRAIAHHFVQGDFKDFHTVLDFGRNCELLTIEIENVNTKALKQLVLEGIPVWPQPEVIELIQDKRLQKQFYKDHNIPTADFVLVEDKQDAISHTELLPAFFKLGKAGYDGRGVQKLTSKKDFEELLPGPGLLERLVEFEKEISVIVARNLRGEITSFPAVELVFNPDHHLVEFLYSPARITTEQELRAQQLARQIIDQTEMVGLLAVEMFVDESGKVLINEIAPRPHNSGHHTIEGNITSQYEQLLRAILNWPLGSTDPNGRSAMVNLLGAPGHQGPVRYQGLYKVLTMKGVHIHLYGKKITKPFRKMGHVTITEIQGEDLEEKAHFVKDTLKIIS
jgi:5-(carboxyamino)imidazole ribonucleotide synthase